MSNDYGVILGGTADMSSFFIVIKRGAGSNLALRSTSDFDP